MRKGLRQPHVTEQRWEVETVTGTSDRDLFTGGLITDAIDQQGSRKQTCSHIPALNKLVLRMQPGIQELLRQMPNGIPTYIKGNKH